MMEKRERKSKSLLVWTTSKGRFKYMGGGKKRGVLKMRAHKKSVRVGKPWLGGEGGKGV